jgi:hypothetical protein
MHCCNPNNTLATTDKRFDDDGFTNAALAERQTAAAHGHAAAAVMAVVGGIVMIGLMRLAFGRHA